MNQNFRSNLIQALLFGMCITTLLLMGAEDRRQEILAHCHHYPEDATCKEPLPESIFDAVLVSLFERQNHGTPTERN